MTPRLLALGLACLTPLLALDTDRYLSVTSAIESSDNDSLIGPCGSRSRYQLSPAVWAQHSRLPFTAARGPQARAVAAAHVAWLRSQTSEDAAQVFWVAYAWRHGARAAREARAGQRPQCPCDYAQRVWNLYYSY